MSVPTYKRSESKLQFQYEAYDLYTDVVKFTGHLLTKYRKGSGDRLQAMAIDVITICNQIAVTDPRYIVAELYDRRSLISAAVAHIDTIGCVVSALIDACKSVDGVESSKLDKMLNNEREIGEHIAQISKLLAGVAKKDINRWNAEHSKEYHIDPDDYTGLIEGPVRQRYKAVREKSNRKYNCSSWKYINDQKKKSSKSRPKFVQPSQPKVKPEDLPSYEEFLAQESRSKQATRTAQEFQAAQHSKLSEYSHLNEPPDNPFEHN